MNFENEFKAKKVIVTGACGIIGGWIVDAFAREGAEVCLTDRDAEKLEAKLATLPGTGHLAIAADLTDTGSMTAFADEVSGRWRAPDILVNNAGISLGKDSLPSDADLGELRAVYETNVFGTIAVIQAMLPLLRKSEAGRIVNMSTGLASLALTRGPDAPMSFSRLLAYNSSKTALNAVTVQFANELQNTAVKVNAANPGLCATDLSGGKGRPPAEGAKVAIALALLDADGPTGGHFGDAGQMPW